MKLRSVAAPLLALAVSVGLAACGGGDDDSAGGQTDPPAASTAAAEAPVASSAASTASGASAASAEFNDADVTFAQGMIPHHEQAIEMADIALDPTVGSSAEVQELAEAIQAAQDPEIELMTGWLTAWGQPVQMDTGGGHDMSSMEGVMSADEMDALGTATGTEFDSMWLEMMIRHHEGAISMANAVKANGLSADAVTLADAIITAQQAEITTMQGLLGS